ncbi:MAG: carboxymuconolactone decarboxylase family protein [Phenylobacterium sp.]|uniref:carboxymuconolactone decarboxylase family protein n=1 Tax=Phenylobacterium sp. TaxID=1871053 RepID=UPI001A45701F|nr:carboxymuconolactone decarboxylase family protein [Phenylobacterium sp.]MBL8554680.1 carboxymuconolactone decarboxylase family protein [Phenylobacterium sp.]
MTPLPFPDAEALPEPLRAELARRLNLNVFRMLMHTPGVAPGFLAMTDALRFHNSLPAHLMELAILRVGRRYAAAYETHHHERLARAAGLSEAAIAATQSGDAAGLSPDEALVLSLTDEMLDAHGLSSESRVRALARFDPNGLADLVLTVGHYQQVCNFLNVFGVPIEAAASPNPGAGGAGPS